MKPKLRTTLWVFSPFIPFSSTVARKTLKPHQPRNSHKIQIHIPQIDRCFKTKPFLIFPNNLTSSTMPKPLSIDQECRLKKLLSLFHCAHRLNVMVLMCNSSDGDLNKNMESLVNEDVNVITRCFSSNGEKYPRAMVKCLIRQTIGKFKSSCRSQMNEFQPFQQWMKNQNRIHGTKMVDKVPAENERTVVLPHQLTNATSRPASRKSTVTTAAPVGTGDSTRKRGAQNRAKTSRKNQRSSLHSVNTSDQSAGIATQGRESNMTKTKHACGTQSHPLLLSSSSDEESLYSPSLESVGSETVPISVDVPVSNDELQQDRPPPREIVVTREMCENLSKAKMYKNLSKAKKAMGDNSSRQLDYNLNGRVGKFHLHFADVAEVLLGDKPLPKTNFEHKHGDMLQFSNYQVLDDGKRGLRDQNNRLIHKKVLTYLETAFGIDPCSDDENLPETLDKNAVEKFFRNHETLKAETMPATTVALVEELNGLVPADGPETCELLLLLILGYNDDKIAVVYHRPTGVLFPTISKPYHRLGLIHYGRMNNPDPREKMKGLENLTNLVRKNNDGNQNFNLNPAPTVGGIYRVTRMP